MILINTNRFRHSQRLILADHPAVACNEMKYVVMKYVDRFWAQVFKALVA